VVEQAIQVQEEMVEQVGVEQEPLVVPQVVQDLILEEMV
jgi:hypothetical protein